MTTMLSAALAAAAGWLAARPDAFGRLRSAKVRGRRWRLNRWWFRGLAAIGAAVGAAAAGGLAAGAAGAAVALAGIFPTLTVLALWRRQRARKRAQAHADQIAAACEQVAGLLRVGQVPAAALATAARDAPVLAPAAAAQAVGASVGSVLHDLSRPAGCAGLAELAAAWELCERTGASLTATLDALAGRLTADRAVRRMLAAELAAPRATGRLLAALPVAGIILGYGFGGDPLAFLTGSLPGQLALVGGAALGCAGVWWTERIADAGGG